MTPKKEELGDVKFTQYVRPHGEKRSVTIARSKYIAAKAQDIIEAGFVLECEVLTTGKVYFSIGDPKEDVDLSMRICNNGADVLAAVDTLIEEFDLTEAKSLSEKTELHTAD